MKRAFLTSFVLLCALLFTVSAFAMKNEPEGFRGIPWGAVAPEKNFVEGNKWGLTKVSTADNLGGVYLESEPEEMFIGKAQITSPIMYLFNDEFGFSAVLIEFKGREDYDAIREACIENWGQPDSDIREKNEKIGGDMITSLWLGEKVIIHLSSSSSTLVLGQSDFVLKYLVEP